MTVIVDRSRPPAVKDDMNECTTSRATNDNRADCRCDAGVSFIEILVAVVLLGTVVLATLTALRTTIVGSETNKDHASAHAWLQAAADAIHNSIYASCAGVSSDVADVTDAYESVLAMVAPPTDWASATIEITNVAFWGTNDLTAAEDWGTTCQSRAAGFTENPRQLQIIKIEVTEQGGDFVKSVEVIRGE